MSDKISPQLKLAKKITDHLKINDHVDAIILGGSYTTGTIDNYSDIDLYIFSDTAIPLSYRKEMVDILGASSANLGLSFWDEGDEWIHLDSRIEVDMIFWSRNWIETQLSNLLNKQQASVGYTTSFWNTIKNASILFDRSDWFLALQSKYDMPFPAKLKETIIAKNYPLLRDIIPSYFNQIKKAIERNDRISINHRITAFLASYFDVLFALNEIPNPGEKKIIPFILNNCSKIPEKMELNLEALWSHYSETGTILKRLNGLIDGIDKVLLEEGYDPTEITW